MQKQIKKMKICKGIFHTIDIAVDAVSKSGEVCLAGQTGGPGEGLLEGIGFRGAKILQ